MFWHTTRFQIDLAMPKVMAIVNVTPDSFSDGEHGSTAKAALNLAHQLLKDGADILDIGGESTRPGAAAVSPEEECLRIQPVIEELVQWGVPVSVDTRHTRTMLAALDWGVDIINDVQALRDGGAVQALARHGQAGVCLMHMRGDDPATMQSQITQADVLHEVAEFLSGRVQACVKAGIAAERMVLDPGIGFGKSPDQNWRLLQYQSELLKLGYPLLVGWSRKSTLGLVTGRAVHERLPASIAAAVLAAERGARVIRVHDVAATVDALKVWAGARVGV
jgi:dihydropteroate synthase